jgi:Xaa-Pro aminopeptidase
MALETRHTLKITEQSRTGLFADCTREEYDRRLRRLREQMERAGVDALLLTEETNVRYATAWYEVGWIVPAFFFMTLIPRDEKLPPALIIPEGDQIQTQASWTDTVVRWDYPVGFYTGDVGGNLVKALAGWVGKLGLAGSRIATEMGAHFRMGMSVEAFDGIRAALPGVTWTDCGDVIWPVRSVKSEEEVRRLRESIRITCLGIQAGFEAIRDGVSERDIANVMSAEMHSKGGSEIRFLALYAGPDRALWADSTPRREMAMRPGSLLQFDGGCTYDGYYTDIKRFASLGEPTPDQRRFFEVARASEQAAIDAVAPGVPYSEAYQASQQVLRDAGYSDFVDWCQKMGWSSIGHNIGLNIHEMPGISVTEDEVFQPNQVVSIEPFLYHDGGYPIWEVKNKYGLEDMVLVTDTGHEVLSPDSLLSRDIWVA